MRSKWDLKADDIEILEEGGKEESEACPECQEEKFQHHGMGPSPFKDRKFLPPKEDFS